MDTIIIIDIEESKKPGRTSPYRYSIQSWKHYARKHNAELFVLNERIYPETYMNANWHKVFAFKLLTSAGHECGRVLIVDADTIVHPDAPNIFELSGGKFCAVHNDGSYDWMLRSMENYSHHLFNGFTFNFTEYFNSGLLLVDKHHVGFFDDVIQYYHDNAAEIRWMQTTYGVGTDQPVLNFLVHMHIPDKLKILPYEWNMQELPRREVLDLNLTFVNYGWVYHFNGIHPDFKINPHDSSPAVEQWMGYVYNKLYN